jgi:hypothetical protein
LVLAPCALALGACSREDGHHAATEPEPAGEAHFRDVTRACGITFVHHNGFTGKRNLLEAMGGGIAVIDYDGDGKQDLYFVDSGAVPTKTAVQAPGGNKLYRNLGGWKFEDVTARAGVAGRGYGMGAIVGDYDNDGDQDLYITNYGSNILYRNEGNGTFRDVTREAGCDDARWSTGAAFLDFDRDGRLDLFVQNYLDFEVEKVRPYSVHGLSLYPPPDIFDPIGCSLFRNRGDGTFEDVSQAAGIAGHLGKGLGVLVADFDGDGDSDIYCANDTAANFLFENTGAGFKEVGLLSGAAYSEEGREEAGMGVDAADVDGDGALDIVVTNFQGEANSVYRGEGGLYFTEMSSRTGMAEVSRGTLGFGVRWFDYDDDGLQDLVVANGHVYDNAPLIDPSATSMQPAHLFRGLGRLKFERVDPRVAPEFATPHFGRGLALADLDDDGDLDLVITNIGAAPCVYENVGGNRNAWVAVRCVGTKRDSTAIGARVTVEVGGAKQFNDVRSGGSYLSQSDLRVFFGLGAKEQLDRVEVRWPDGTREEARDVPARRQLVFVEGRGLLR